MRKLLNMTVVAALTTMAVASIASAGSNYANGTTISGTSTNAALSGIITCSSSVSGPLTNLSPGITLYFESATFSNCQPSGSTATACNLPWDMHLTSTADDNVWRGTITNVCVDISTPLTGTCRYTGSLRAVSYTNSTHTLNLSGSLTRQSGLCPSTGTTTGQYTVSPSDLAINTN